MKKNRSFLTFVLQFLVVVIFIMGIYVFMNDDISLKKTEQSQDPDVALSASSASVSKKSEQNETEADNSGLPSVSSSDWELVLVNRDNITEEMSPELTSVGSIYVDSRIAEHVTNFLEAAQAIDSSEHLISGYRSVTYQEEIYNSYIAQEMAADPTLTEESAAAIVQTYSQPAGASEHQTGLAIDMSTVDSLNESDVTVAGQVQAMAPEYGFVLRFPDGKSDVTGVNYEDWHFRYVGVESAKYMTEHNLTLEEYVALLKENNQ